MVGNTYLTLVCPTKVLNTERVVERGERQVGGGWDGEWYNTKTMEADNGRVTP